MTKKKHTVIYSETHIASTGILKGKYITEVDIELLFGDFLVPYFQKGVVRQYYKPLIGRRKLVKEVVLVKIGNRNEYLGTEVKDGVLYIHTEHPNNYDIALVPTGR